VAKHTDKGGNAGKASRSRKAGRAAKAKAKAAKAGAAKAPTVRAAGGVVWRRGDDGLVEVVVVHRPRYDDWSFPKGKREKGEADEDTARREVEEETGLICDLGPELTAISYTAKGRPKHVRYWAMTVRRRREREPDDEVDEWRWVPYGEVAELLTYAHDRRVSASLRHVLPGV
jgi:8-oxo-dGTP pyrophosphatase MutT (NUDIX family)